MTAFLPPNLLALFAPRDPIPYIPPVDKLPHEKKTQGYSGIGSYASGFEDPKDTPKPVKAETRDERQERLRKEKVEQMAYKLEQEIALWSAEQTDKEGDAFKTLFVGRINYDTSESKLRREFEEFGPVRKITVVHNQENGKPRGYAFIEYEHERDMHAAYKHADGRKIDGRRILVDVERGRTVNGWLPRRLGGGLGGTRRGGPEVNIKVSGREDGYGKAALDGRMNRSASRERVKPRDRDRERDRPRRDKDRRPGDEERRRRSRSRDRGRDRRDRDRDRDRDRRKRSRSRDRRDRRRGDKMREDSDIRVKPDIKDEPDTSGYEQYGGGFGGGFNPVKKEQNDLYNNEEQYGGFNAQDY